MSDKGSTPDADSPEPKKVAKKEAPLADLSALSFGPAWAKEKSKKERTHTPRSKESSSREKGSRERRQGGSRNERRGDRRDQRQGGRGRQGDRRDQRNARPVVAIPEGVKARIMPIEEGLDALAKQIADTGRTHSVFDLAWLVLGGLERFHVIFEREKEPLYRSRSDSSLWLNKNECLSHFWANGTLTKYYDEEITEVEAPAGNFQSVARCGLSRNLIGPPNHHAYQQSILDLHREKFSNMPLEKYKQKITMEHGEEVVQEWLESMKKYTCWKPKKTQADAPDDKKGEEPSSEVVAEIPAEASDEEVVILNSRRELEQHFLTHCFELEYESGNTMSVRANISPKLINSGLLALQKNIVSESRKYPGDLASILCRQMSGRHLAVFKWKKRLHCGPARPKHLAEDLVMADRPMALFKWVTENAAGEIDAMWKEVLAKDIDDETKKLWYHDLHWLINEGFVLLFSDGKLHAAKELEKAEVKADAKPAKKAAEKKPADSPVQPEPEK